jgi:N-acetylmuramic acid 6-phosphate etherase
MSPDISTLATESVDPRYADIDRLSVADLAALMNEADTTVPHSVRAALPQIIPAIEAVCARLAGGGRLVYVGAGTSGRLGVLDAAEIPPTYSSTGQVLALIAGGAPAVTQAVEGAEDDEQAGAAAIDEAGVGPADAIVGVASSGRTPYVLGAVRRSAQRGALTVGFSCNADTELSHAADLAIEVPVGPEVVSGSTRLKAGTAQKLVLNMMSTIAMVRLGKTYGNLMVDVDASNAKLRDRAERIVMRVSQVPRPVAKAALDATSYDVKQAVVVLTLGVDPHAARDTLEAAGGRLRDVLEAHP